MQNKCHKKHYDVVVVGGGLAGVCAAISSARLGVKTALIHDRPVLGGNSSSEIKVTPSGANQCGQKRHLRETGIIEELLMESWNRDPLRSFSLWDVILWEKVFTEPGLELFLNSSAQAVIMKDEKEIKAIHAIQISTEKEFILEGSIFIDCTGDGAVAFKSGAEFRMGREGKSQYGEDSAPAYADSCLLPSSLTFIARDIGKAVRFKAPEWAKKFKSDDDFPHRIHQTVSQGYWWIAYGGTWDTIAENEKIKYELLSILFGVWDHIKNYGDHGADNYALEWIGSVPGKRESRRFIGDYVLNQNDIETQVLFPDRIAYGGWNIDLHSPKGFYSKSGPFEHYRFLKEPYSIPLCCLYSRDINNLMFAGRNISVSHVALGSTRIQCTGAILGQVVGTTAFLCRKYNLVPRLVRQRHIEELQQLLLKNDCFIINCKNRDSEDLALKANISSSSTEKCEVRNHDEFKPLNVCRAELFPVSGSRIDKIYLLLKSSSGQDVNINLHLRKAKTIWKLDSTEDLAVSSALIPANTEKWVCFDFNVALGNGLYWIWISETEKISWAFSSKECPGLQSAVFNKEYGFWDTHRGDYCFVPEPESYPFTGSNVNNGTARPEQWPNIWISDSSKALPQYVDLKFGENISFNVVHITFNTNLSTYIPFDNINTIKKIFPEQKKYMAEAGIGMPDCVKDYCLYCRKNGRWEKILEVNGNYQRFRKHSFDTLLSDELRLEILSTNGSASAQVYEIRVYNEK